MLADIHELTKTLPFI